jgi:hypothetical protein
MSKLNQLQKESAKKQQLILWLVEKMGGSIEVPFDYETQNFEYNVEVTGNSFTIHSRISEDEQA